MNQENIKNKKGGMDHMKKKTTMKLTSVAVLSAAIMLTSVGTASAMVNEDGTPVAVPTSQDQYVIMSLPGQEVPNKEDYMNVPKDTSDGRVYKGDQEAVNEEHSIHYDDGIHDKTIQVNGKKLELNGAVIYGKDGKLMLPLRSVAEAMGYTVSWNGKDQQVKLTKGEFSTEIKIGTDNYVDSNSNPVKFGVAPELTNGSTYIPVKFFAQILDGGYQVIDSVIQIDTLLVNPAGEQAKPVNQ